jgi:hypothetical protein
MRLLRIWLLIDLRSAIVGLLHGGLRHVARPAALLVEQPALAAL